MKNQSQTPPAASEKESLISSDTLPEFAALEAEYAASMASIETEEKGIKKSRKKKEVVSEGVETSGEILDEELLDPDEIEDICSFPFDSYYTRKGKEKLSNIERKALARSIAKVVNKWIPKIGGQWKEEIGLFICLTAIMGSRYERKEEKKNEKDISKDIPNVFKEKENTISNERNV